MTSIPTHNAFTSNSNWIPLGFENEMEMHVEMEMEVEAREFLLLMMMMTMMRMFLQARP